MKRYAIRIRPGEYSPGPNWAYRRGKGVPFEKAKHWKNLGHVKMHLQGRDMTYPPGTEVVEVILIYTESVCATVANLEEQNKIQAQLKQAESMLRCAERNLKDAQNLTPKEQKVAKAASMVAFARDRLRNLQE